MSRTCRLFGCSLLSLVVWALVVLPAFSQTESAGKSFAPLESLQKPEPSGWSFTLEPYLWAMGSSGEVGVRGWPASQVDFSAKTILQHLDWGVMGKGEVRKGRWGLLADGFFAQLSASGDPPAPLYSNNNVTIQQGMASLALAYRLIDDRRGFLDVYAGARYNYMGMNMTASTDSQGIKALSEEAAQLISRGVAKRVDTYLAANADALASQAADAAKTFLTNKALDKLAGLPDDFTRRDVMKAVKQVSTNSAAYRELLTAVAQARVAALKGQLTSALQERVAKAEKKVAKTLARQIENRLPTSTQGSQWWVDPIVGLRTQVNFTRWLFLAAQGDVGGFGAGSTIAWNVQASLGVNFTRHIFGEVGYRYFYMDYSNGGFLYQAAEYGVFAGLGARL